MVTLLLLVIYVAFISLGLPDALLGVAWPLMQVEYAVPVSLAGLVSMTISVNTIISSVLSGRVLKRFGTGRVTFVSVLMTATALLGFSFAPNFIWLVLLAIPLGLGAGSVDAGLNNYVAKNYAASHMNWLHSFWGVGAMSGPIIISQFISNSDSWRNGYLSVAVLQFVLVIVLFFTLPLWKKVAHHTPPNVEMPQSTDEKPEQTDASNGSLINSILSPLRIKGVTPVLVVFFLYCGIEWTMGLWGSSFLVRVKGIDVATAAIWVSFYFGSITLGRFLNGFVAMRVSGKTIIRTGEIFIFIGVIALLLPLPNIFSMLGFILVGLGCAPIFPTMLHETPARFGDEDSQNIMGFQMAVAYIGTSILPPLFGVIASVTSFMIFPIVLLGYIVIMLINSELVNKFMVRKRKLNSENG